MTFEDVKIQLELEGYKSYFNDIDEGVIARISPCRCGGSFKYYGFKNGNSYRAFYVCSQCGNYQEF